MSARVVAFGPGRANLIGEHTDYNDGLSLPFAIEQGVRVEATPADGPQLLVRALDVGEQERFALDPIERSPEPGGGWRDFVRGALGELEAAGHELCGGELSITGDVPQGGGLSSSAALEVALCLALIAMAGGEQPGPGARIRLARLCSRIENDWVGAHTGLLDQLASLLGERGHALRIDFRTLEARAIPFDLGDWRLVTVDSGEQHSLAASGYNERRAECERARDLLELESLRDAERADLADLPEPLDRRVRHVIEENERVDATVDALERQDLERVGILLRESHASLRDLYEASTDAVERTVERLEQAGAAGARMMGGGFGGHVIALLRPGAELPDGANEVRPAAGGRLL